MPPAKTFARYSDLPVELRRQIVQEAAKPLIDACYIGSGVKIKHELCSSRTSLAQYACLDSVWKEVIELPTFQRLCLTLDDIRPFGVICGKRRGILHYIDLDLREGTWPPQFQAIDLETMISLGFHALFGIMKNWDPAERKRKSLIKIGLHLSDANDGAVVRHDFSRLPKVRVIGELEQPRLDLLQPSTIISLYERLPNANRLVLNLLLAPTVPGSIQEATNTICSLRDLSCNPTKLRLWGHGSIPEDWIGVQEQFRVAQCLTTAGRRWNDTLATLEIFCLNDVALLLEDAGKAAWPQLKTLRLVGMFDSAPVGSRKETGSRVVQCLIALLPLMPRIVTVEIDIEPYSEYQEMFVDLYLGSSPTATHFTDRRDAPFVPDPSNGIAKLSGFSISGQLAAELQDVVWRSRGRMVSVFRLPGNKYGIWLEEDDPDDPGDLDDFYDGWDWDRAPRGYFKKCQQWNREKDAWECFRWEWTTVRHGAFTTYPARPKRYRQQRID